MGYIDSATTITLRLTLTDEGRNKMLNTGTQVMDLFDKFGISDGDIDYRNTQIHADTTNTSNDSAQLGYLPNVTGNLTNFRQAVNNGYKLNNFVWSTPQNNKIISSPKTYVAVGFRGNDNLVKHYRDNVEIDVYLHDYFVLNKLLSLRYIDDHKDILSSDPTGVSESVSNYYNDVLNVKTNKEYLNLLNDLSEHGIGQYLDFWDSVKVYNGTTLKSENVKLVPQKDDSYYNALALAGGAFMGRGEHTGIDFSNTNLKGTKIASPFSMVFSPGINSNNSRYVKGAGNAGIGFAAFDVGYLNSGGINVWNQNGESYPMFNMTSMMDGWSTQVDNIKNVFVGFVTSVDMENSLSTDNTQLGANGYSNINTTITSARLVLNVATSELSPTYYPIKLKRLTKNQGEYVNINNQEAKGINITTTTHPSDTYGLLVGGLEYTSNWVQSQQGYKSGAPYFNIYPSRDNGNRIEANKVVAQQEPYYTLGTRMMKMSDDIFLNVAGQLNSFWKTDTYTGGFKGGLSGTGISSYNISIPITWNVYSLDSPNATPCKVTVRFKFNKDAVKQSISYNNLMSQNYYRIFDNSTIRFYGEAGADQSSYSQDPRGHGSVSASTYAWQTSGGKALFRKLISGQQI
tara:strand:+ start:27019 stop:28902 length:1884 start_codon:yes stop_codon:yes gene_type:complete